MADDKKIFNEVQRETLIAIADTFVAPLTAEEESTLIQNILAVPNNCFTENQISDFAKMSASSVDIVSQIEKRMIQALSPKQINDFSLVVNMLSYRPSSILFTGYWTLFKDLDKYHREQVLLGWKKSQFSVFKGLFNVMVGLNLMESYMSMQSPLYRSIMYSNIQGGHKFFEKQPDYKKIQHKVMHMLTSKEAKSHSRFDAIIVGSGAGGGVVAAELSKAGLSVLVIEKGKYFHQDDMVVDDDNFAFKNLFENGGTSSNSQLNINYIAASNFGGGTTINYSASIGPQQFVKEQWEKKGLPYFVSPQFENDIESALNRIGASVENIVHSGPNLKLIQGCRNLGYAVNAIAQNTSGKPHHCGKCYTGCASGVKNSTTNTYLKDAESYGAKFLDCTQVTRVIIKNGKAVGVACHIHGQKEEFIFHAKKVIVSGGALHTPGILMKSGLKNPNIGKDLRLHLSALVNGIYDEVINPAEGSLLTTVSNEFDNYDGSTFGFKIECFTNGVGMYSPMMPWNGAAAHKQIMLRHRNSVTTFSMLRDMDSVCNVKYDAYDKIEIDFNLSKHDGDTLIEGIVQMAKIHVAAGAREIHVGQHNVDSFEFRKDEESRVDNPRFLKWIEYIYTQGPPTPASGHQMASCRMGDSPSTSATKPTGETWDVANLFVADSSLFPTALGVNPMVTIQAIALSVSRHIIMQHKTEEQAKL